MQPLLQVEHLFTEFPSDEGTFTAVNDVSFSLQQGETVGIVGESGSGKSVTSLSIMRLLASPGRIRSGSIVYQAPGKEAVAEVYRRVMRSSSPLESFSGAMRIPPWAPPKGKFMREHFQVMSMAIEATSPRVTSE